MVDDFRSPTHFRFGLFVFILHYFYQKNWKVLIMDKNEIFDGKLTASRPQNLSFDFINAFVEYDDFAKDEKYKDYDLAVQINEKIVSNKHVIISYKEYPPENIQRHLVYYVE